MKDEGCCVRVWPCHRTYKSYADDLAQLADQLGVEHFFVAGVSGGLYPTSAQ
jgi:pimeloyl-ACP methyl ester carboxylesterase